MIRMTNPITMRIVISYAMKWASCGEFDMETETKTEFPNGEKIIVEQIIASEEINKSKTACL